MNKVIVTTSVQSPTEAIEKFDCLKDWKLIVVGDLKTPKDYRLKNGIYLSAKEQESYDKELSDLIGWNTHARRNFGHLLAKDLNADIIAIVDDDNIPLEGWGKNIFAGNNTEVNYYETELEAFDPVGATNYPNLWHRGFPIQLIHQRDYGKVSKKEIKIDIQADFWDGDPDIDAICRIAYAPSCKFARNCFPIASNKPSPFNSQNIFVTSEVLRHCFFLPFISPLGRQSDIWIAYHIQSLGYKVAYFEPSVYQQRNKHDLLTDLSDELIGYKKNIEIVRSINEGAYEAATFWPEKTLKAYQAYEQHWMRK